MKLFIKAYEWLLEKLANSIMKDIELEGDPYYD